MEQQPQTDHQVCPPFLRVYVLGPTRIDYWDPLSRSFIPLPAEKWHNKGALQGQTLMELLISQPHRCAHRDWVLEQFWPMTTQSKAERNLDNMSNYLHTLFSGLNKDGEELFSYVRKIKSLGGTYHLAQYPLVWVDADAFLWHMQHAALYKRMGDDPLPFLEAAYPLGARGTYLVEAPYCDWAKTRRTQLDGAFRSCVHQIGHLSLKHGHLDEAECYVRSYWATHMTDEDALRLLMTILGKQERFQEAHDCYRQTCEVREQAEEAIDPRTHDLAEYWRTKPLSSPAKSFPQPSPVPPSQPPSLQAYENVIQFLQVIQAVLPRTVSNEQVLSVPSESDTSLIIVLPTPEPSPEMALFDLAIWLSDRANRLRALGTSGPPITNQKRQADVFSEIKSWNRMVDQDHPLTNEFLSSRRSVLTGLLLVSDIILKWVRSGQVTPFIAKEFLAQCATSIVACDVLLKGDGLAAVAYALPRYLPHLIALAEVPSPVQKEAAYLAAQGCCLMDTVKLHQQQLGASVACCQQAVEFAEVTGDSMLIAATLTRLGYAWYYFGELEKYLKAYQDAERLIPKDPPLFPSRLLSRIYTGLSAAYARTGHPQEANDYLDLANAIPLLPGDDLFIPCLDYDLSFKILTEGCIHHELGEPKDQNRALSKEARSHLHKAAAVLGQDVSKSNGVTKRVLIEGINKRTLVAIQLGDLDNFIISFKDGVLGAKALGSKKREQEAIDNLILAQQIWQYEDQVRKLWEWWHEGGGVSCNG